MQLINLASPTIANAPLVRVFDPSGTQPNLPPEGPHYVGTFSFFGTAAQRQTLETVEPSSGQRFSAADLCIADAGDADAKATTSVSVELPLTQALQRLELARKPVGDILTVQLVPVALGNTLNRLRFSRRRSRWSFSDRR